MSRDKVGLEYSVRNTDSFNKRGVIHVFMWEYVFFLLFYPIYVCEFLVCGQMYSISISGVLHIGSNFETQEKIMFLRR